MSEDVYLFLLNNKFIILIVYMLADQTAGPSGLKYFEGARGVT